ALVSLGPPPAERADLASDWRQLVAWVVTKRSEVEAGATAAASEATLLGREHGALKAEIDQWCADGGVAPAGRPASEAVAVARAQADAERQRVEAAIEEAQRVRTELSTVRAAGHVAHTLAVHLRADRFEKWLL